MAVLKLFAKVEVLLVLGDTLLGLDFQLNILYRVVGLYIKCNVTKRTADVNFHIHDSWNRFIGHHLLMRNILWHPLISDNNAWPLVLWRRMAK